MSALARDTMDVESRAIVHRTRGQRHGPIVRLMSPSDLGRQLKPFVFLDYFDLESSGFPGFGLHPHSGIATVTVVLEGRTGYVDTEGRSGVIEAGGVEWMKAGGGAWHAGGSSDAPRVRGFQLWIALPPAWEASAPESVYVDPDDIPREAPVSVILGRHGKAEASIETPDAMNYFVVRLKAGDRWTYSPPRGHAVAWLAIAVGTMRIGNESVQAGECVAFERSDGVITFEASSDVEFVVGSAFEHRHDLVLGHYSVHSSPEALAAGERRVAELGRALKHERG